MKCPDCGTEMEPTTDFETDWHGHLAYYWCPECEEEYVRQSGDEPELAA